MALAPEPYTGYYASDPIWSPAVCAELYTIMGPQTRVHNHSLTGPVIPIVTEDGGNAAGTASGSFDGGSSGSTLTGVLDGGSAFG